MFITQNSEKIDLGRCILYNLQRVQNCSARLIVKKRKHEPILHPSSLSFTGCLWNFIFNTNWLFWLSIILRVLFLHICPLFFTFINHHVFFTHLLKNCLKFPRLTVSQLVNAHFILLSRLFGTRFQAAFVT